MSGAAESRRTAGEIDMTSLDGMSWRQPGEATTWIHSTRAICCRLMTWRVETLNEIVDRELDALPDDMQARFARVGRLIATFGLERVGAPHARHLTGPLWEIRLSGRDGLARALYIVATGRRVVVVRAFVKKTRRTPRREIELALRRAGEVMQ